MDEIQKNKVYQDVKCWYKSTLFVSSWNVGGIAPPNDLNMEELLDTRNNLADIYVLGSTKAPDGLHFAYAATLRVAVPCKCIIICAYFNGTERGGANT
uniref:Inositol polyphosphate-related phosphatase domain-containing protein n=1 Tax=Solanum lycopersicum TaxID=4081 RepID=A0A3Q7H205_SOLLC